MTGLESIVSQRRNAFDELTDKHRDAIRDAVREFRGDRLAADLRDTYSLSHEYDFPQVRTRY